jgi:hypothetical protein
VPKREERTYTCACGRVHDIPMYVAAQNGAGFSVSHTCDCGRVNKHMPSGKIIIGKLPKAAAAKGGRINGS